MKSFKKLLIPIVVLVVLIAAVIIVMVMNGDKEKIIEGPYTVVDYGVDEVQSLTVDRKNKDSLLISYNKDPDGKAFFSLDEGGFTGKAYSQDAFSNYVTILSSFVASGRFEKGDYNLADYGLVDPDYKITIEAKNGDVRVLSIGNDTLSGGQCYMTINGDSNIYTVPTVKKTFCGYDVEYFYDSVNMNIAFDNLDSVTFERSYDDLSLKCSTEIYETGNAVFTIVEPFRLKAGQFLTTLLNDIGNLELSSFVALTDEQIEEYGLNDPTYHFSFVYKDGKSKEISLTASQNGMFYGYSSETESYFAISTQQIKYIDAPLMDLVYSYVYYLNVKDVIKIECVAPEAKFVFDIQTEDKISSDDAVVLLNSRNAKLFNTNGRCYAAILFETISCIQIGGIETELPEDRNEPEITISIIDTNYKKTILSFEKRDSASYYCFIDGAYTGFYVYATELYNDGGLDTYNYGVIGAYNLLNKAIDENINGIYELKVGKDNGSGENN